MIIGHIPAGYLMSRLLPRISVAVRALKQKPVIWAALVGSVFPDFDLLYFYLLDERQHHHHTYWTHLPIFWIVVLPLALLVLRAVRKTTAYALTLVFGCNVLLHLVLDSIVGHIWWLYPVVDQPYSLATVPAVYKPWWMNFILHRSFLLEIGLLATAVFLYVRERSATRASTG